MSTNKPEFATHKGEDLSWLQSKQQSLRIKLTCHLNPKTSLDFSFVEKSPTQFSSIMACVSSYWLLSLGLMGLTFGDITNIKINDHSPFWLGSNESFQDFPESSVPSDDDTDGVGTTTAEFPVASDDFGTTFHLLKLNCTNFN